MTSLQAWCEHANGGIYHVVYDEHEIMFELFYRTSDGQYYLPHEYDQIPDYELDDPIGRSWVWAEADGKSAEEIEILIANLTDTCL